jgi:hypothetical protein
MAEETIDGNTRIEICNGTPFVIDGAGDPLEVNYGLPPTVQFCKKCVYSN